MKTKWIENPRWPPPYDIVWHRILLKAFLKNTNLIELKQFMNLQMSDIDAGEPLIHYSHVYIFVLYC
jgi:hypothetical protein